MARAGYDMRIAETDSRCGGCGADISQGAEYGYDPIAMKICEGCIEVFEEEDHVKKRTFTFHDLDYLRTPTSVNIDSMSITCYHASNEYQSDSPSPRNLHGI